MKSKLKFVNVALEFHQKYFVMLKCAKFHAKFPNWKRGPPVELKSQDAPHAY